CYIDESYVSSLPEPVAPGQYVMIAVADTGVGMDKATVDKAFEPFFTTKETGKGTGLGLSQVYGFVRQSGGFLAIESSPGSGTKIGIHLPEVVAGSVRPDASSVSRIGSGVILVVEDDADVRELVAMQLEDLGYLSIIAGSGPEALAILAAPDPPSID